VPWAGFGGLRVVAGLLAQLLAERGQDPGARRPAAAVDQGAAAGALGPAELVVKGAGPSAQRPRGLSDAGMPGDDEQVVQALSRVRPDQGAAERFGQVARVDAGG
jgi:hypothetical protein